MSSDQTPSHQMARDNFETLKCPVCRARQPCQRTCRRCSADLELLVRAKNRLKFVLAQRDQAKEADDALGIQKASNEIQWLAPKFRSPPTSH